MLSMYKRLSDKVKYYHKFNRADYFKRIPESYVRKYLIPCNYPKTHKKQHMHPLSMFQFNNFVKETDWEVTEEDKIYQDSIIDTCCANGITFQFNLDYACNYDEGERDNYDDDEDDDFSW